MAFGSEREAFLSLITIPSALIDGAYLAYFYGVNLSVSVTGGFIDLFGIAVETGVLMVIYLNDAMNAALTIPLVGRRRNAARSLRPVRGRPVHESETVRRR